MIKPTKQLKDTEHTEAIIKITKVREHYSDGKGSHSFKDKLVCIKITKPAVIASTCFPDTKKGRKELLKFICKELYL